MNLDSLPQQSLSNFLQGLSPFRILPSIISLSLCNSQITPDQLSALLVKLPQLKEIDIRGCDLHKHALEVLAQCINLESMAFSHENAPLSEGHSLDSAFSPWIQLKRFSVAIRPDIDLLLSFQQLQEAASRIRLNLESLELSASFCRLDTLSPRSWGSLHSVTIHMSTLKRPMEVIQEYLSTHIGVGRSRVSSYKFRPLTHATKALTSLTLDCCEFSSIRLRGILDQCVGLERLHIHLIMGPEAVWDLFGGSPWTCTRLQELVLNRIVWSSGDSRLCGFYEDPLEATWKSLTNLHRLRVLTLRHVNRTGGNGLASNSLSAMDWFGVSRCLERLCLTGHGAWRTRDLNWVADSLPFLEKLEYNEEDINKTQLAWFQEHRPDVRLAMAAPSEARLY